MEPVVPPQHEALPVEGVMGADVDKVKQRFQDLINEVGLWWPVGGCGV